MLKDNLKYLNSLKEKSDYAFPKKDWDPGFIEKLKIDLTYHSNKIEGFGTTIGFIEMSKSTIAFEYPSQARNHFASPSTNHQINESTNQLPQLHLRLKSFHPGIRHVQLKMFRIRSFQ